MFLDYYNLQPLFMAIHAALCSIMPEGLAIFRRPVADVIAERFANSLALMICAWLFSGVIGFVLG